MSNHDLPDELSKTAERLRSDRPELDAHGLDRVHGRIVGRAPRPARRSRQSLAITLRLAFGLVFSGAGAGLGVSGLSSDGAAAVQYGAVAGTQAESPTIGDPGDPGTEAANPSDGNQAVAVASDGKLPFTGSASLLILGLGGVLLITGAVLRRRTMRGHDG